MKNEDLVRQGQNILNIAMAPFICKSFRNVYRDRWWSVIRTTLSGDKTKRLPDDGSYEELLASLDAACCYRLFRYKWWDVFANRFPVRTADKVKAWAEELAAYRNIISHLGGGQDLDRKEAERALETMILLGQQIDAKTAKEIRELYEENFGKETAEKPAETGLSQPESLSARGALTEGSLLKETEAGLVEKTVQTWKITFGGKTQVYPVYRVRLDALYYNDQNDRIATWISGYESENGADSLQSLDRSIYNRIIENFIVESNEEAIERTQKNIELVGQQRPGVTLADGRVVDGNRRFTCLRRLQRETEDPVYFETVILDVDIHADRKEIKKLELALQHGEDRKVDYDLIDFAVGTYRAIVKEQLLTLQEFVDSTKESPSEVKKRIRVAEIVNEFLEYIGLPEQYNIAREYQVYSVFQEMLAPLNQINEEDQKKLKQTAFSNAVLGVVPDQRKFIRDIKGLVKNGGYQTLLKEQEELQEQIGKDFVEFNPSNEEELKTFAELHREQAESLRQSMESALQKSRSKQIQAKPIESAQKCADLLMDVDPRLFVKMTPEQVAQFRKQLKELKDQIGYLEESLGAEEKQ